MNLVPLPASLVEQTGQFRFDAATTIAALGEALPAAQLFAEYVGGAVADPPGAMRFDIADLTFAVGNAQAYRVDITPGGVACWARTTAGLFNAVQTLRQLLPPEALAPAGDGVPGSWSIPCVTVEDAPLLPHRGLMLDVARHFFALPDVLRLLDTMALHRLNVLHLHLTEDQGWRMEIRKYPRLTEVGSRRPDSADTEYAEDPKASGPAHEGFYTQEELRQLVAYAGARGITVVPEIEVPGHVQAALAAYPELGNNPGTALDVWARWGINEHTLNAEQSTVDFFKDVLDEVMDVFPSSLIHLGGDECPKTEWESTPRAHERARELGLEGPHELQDWIMNQLAAHVAAQGRRAVAWDDAGAHISKDIVVMGWHAGEPAEAAAERGHDVIQAPWQGTYFDLAQSDSGEPVAQPGVLPLRDAYSFDPYAGRFAEELRSRVVGAQCQLWTEYIPTAEHLQYMAFPRVAAFAERAWGSTSDYASFVDRLGEHVRRLDALGVHHRPLTAPDRPRDA